MAMRYPDINYFGTLYEEINKIFRELLRSDPAAERALETLEIPPVDIYETEAEVVLELELPGVDAKRLQVGYSGGKLVVEGFKTEQVEQGRLNYICMERSFGRFQRIIPLSRTVDLRAGSAVYRMGILTIRLPKMPEKRGERIEIPVQRVEEVEERGE